MQNAPNEKKKRKKSSQSRGVASSLHYSLQKKASAAFFSFILFSLPRSPFPPLLLRAKTRREELIALLSQPLKGSESKRCRTSLLVRKGDDGFDEQVRRSAPALVAPPGSRTKRRRTKQRFPPPFSSFKILIASTARWHKPGCRARLRREKRSSERGKVSSHRREWFAFFAKKEQAGNRVVADSLAASRFPSQLPSSSPLKTNRHRHRRER